MRHSKVLLMATFLACTVLVPLARADEGMWLFNQFPKTLVEQRYGFRVSDEFLETLRTATVRITHGTASFVSADGLLFTNHHVGADCVQKLSSAQHDYFGNGFYAATPAEERTCPDTEVRVLLKIEDVTAKVQAAVQPSMSGPQANRARKNAMTGIEKQCAASTANTCDVVSFYSGGQYHLYQYKKYTDIRLVFAPEADIAAFGGDPDNYTYPRYCLDFALFRVYENGKPIRPVRYFKWSREGVKEGDLIFVPGNPGSTGRLLTVAELEFSRDYRYPLWLRQLKSSIRATEVYGSASSEATRVARDSLFSQQNSFKRFDGFLTGLKDAKLIELKRKEETQLREAVARDPKLAAEFGRVWDEIAVVHQDYRAFFKPHMLLETSAARTSDLFGIARKVLRYAEESAKPEDKRLREYVTANLAIVERAMYSPAPIEDSFEIAMLADYLRSLQQELGSENPVVSAALAGMSPETAARHYVSTSKLKDVAERKRLAKSVGAVRSSSDGMIQLARILDRPARLYRQRYEDEVEARLTAAAPKIARARFAVRGAADYPDATFTLRLTFGGVRSYKNAAGQAVPFTTTFDGLYKRATGKDPFKLPARWVQRKSALRLDTPFNFVSTADTHGGNSGSPTLNAKGEIVGILFDGNLEGLPNNFVFTDEQARSIHVSSQGILEALRKVYRADRVVNELRRSAQGQ
jgi:hypothetical protein